VQECQKKKLKKERGNITREKIKSEVMDKRSTRNKGSDRKLFLTKYSFLIMSIGTTERIQSVSQPKSQLSNSTVEWVVLLVLGKYRL
jgi:hypothetical protein